MDAQAQQETVWRLKRDADGRSFGLRSPRDRLIARHGYLLALEELERSLQKDDERSGHAA
jgi:hypothetical protein